LSHGLYLNDLCLTNEHRSIAHCLNDAGYSTGYIGKWHIDGQGRSEFTPNDRRQGFQFWRGLECTHNYNQSFYYADSPKRIPWEGYEPIAQTRMAQEFLTDQTKAEEPFALFVSWGPPHAPYHTAPKKYRDMYAGREFTLRGNVPVSHRAAAQRDYLGYYAHMTALDDCVGDLMKTLEATGQAENTIVVYTSDHGDMMRSHGFMKKQQPWDESARVPFLVRWLGGLGRKKRETAARYRHAGHHADSAGSVRRDRSHPRRCGRPEPGGSRSRHGTTGSGLRSDPDLPGSVRSVKPRTRWPRVPRNPHRALDFLSGPQRTMAALRQ